MPRRKWLCIWRLRAQWLQQPIQRARYHSIPLVLLSWLSHHLRLRHDDLIIVIRLRSASMVSQLPGRMRTMRTGRLPWWWKVSSSYYHHPHHLQDSPSQLTYMVILPDITHDSQSHWLWHPNSICDDNCDDDGDYYVVQFWLCTICKDHDDDASENYKQASATRPTWEISTSDSYDRGWIGGGCGEDDDTQIPRW